MEDRQEWISTRSITVEIWEINREGPIAHHISMSAHWHAMANLDGFCRTDGQPEYVSKCYSSVVEVIKELRWQMSDCWVKFPPLTKHICICTQHINKGEKFNSFTNFFCGSSNRIKMIYWFSAIRTLLAISLFKVI